MSRALVLALRLAALMDPGGESEYRGAGLPEALSAARVDPSTTSPTRAPPDWLVGRSPPGAGDGLAVLLDARLARRCLAAGLGSDRRWRAEDQSSYT